MEKKTWIIIILVIVIVAIALALGLILGLVVFAKNDTPRNPNAAPQVYYNNDWLFTIANTNGSSQNATIKVYDENNNVKVNVTQNINSNGNILFNLFTYVSNLQYQTKYIFEASFGSKATRKPFTSPVNDEILNSLLTSQTQLAYLEAERGDWIQVSGSDWTAIINNISPGFVGQGNSELVGSSVTQGKEKTVTYYSLQMSAPNYIFGLKFKATNFNKGYFQIVYTNDDSSSERTAVPNLPYLTVNINQNLTENDMYYYVLKGSDNVINIPVYLNFWTYDYPLPIVLSTQMPTDNSQDCNTTSLYQNSSLTKDDFDLSTNRIPCIEFITSRNIMWWVV